MSYTVISYTQEELDYFYGLTKEIEKKEGKKLVIDELIDKAIEDKNNDLINFLHYMQSMQRSKIIEDKLKNTNFNFREEKDKPQNYTEKEVDEFEETLNYYWKDGMLDLYETIDKAIENKNFKLINYLHFIETKKEHHIIQSKISKQIFKDMEEKEKKFKKFKEKVIKKLNNFKEVKERKDADILLIINKNELNNYDIRLNDFCDKQIEEIKNLDYEVYYFKNCNPHDKRRSSIGFIKRELKERPHRN